MQDRNPHIDFIISLLRLNKSINGLIFRPPVYDLRELQGLDLGEGEINGVGPNSLDKERNMVNDDPKWQGDVNFC